MTNRSYPVDVFIKGYDGKAAYGTITDKKLIGENLQRNRTITLTRVPQFVAIREKQPESTSDWKIYNLSQIPVGKKVHVKINRPCTLIPLPKVRDNVTEKQLTFKCGPLIEKQKPQVKPKLINPPKTPPPAPSVKTPTPPPATTPPPTPTVPVQQTLDEFKAQSAGWPASKLKKEIEDRYDFISRARLTPERLNHIHQEINYLQTIYEAKTVTISGPTGPQQPPQPAPAATPAEKETSTHPLIIPVEQYRAMAKEWDQSKLQEELDLIMEDIQGPMLSGEEVQNLIDRQTIIEKLLK